MYEKYHEQGLEIIDVPCNQFGEQAPGTDEQTNQRVLYAQLQHKVSANEKVGRKRRERIAVVCVFEIAKAI